MEAESSIAVDVAAELPSPAEAAKTGPVEAAEEPRSKRPSPSRSTRGIRGGAHAIRVPRFAELGDAPLHDQLALNAYAHRTLAVALVQAQHDPDLTEAQRRSAICDITGRMTPLVPQARIYQAEQIVKGAQQRATGEVGPKGPETEPSRAAKSVSDDRTDSGAVVRRGRPRKRGLGH